jgi:3-dehydroquinate dehydratase-2
MKLLIINGPNLNMLGIREKHIYGDQDYDALCRMIRAWAEELNCEAELFQSNHEGAIVDRIQQAYFDGTQGIVINPAAYTHTSVAILDALKAVQLPAAEVHLTDVNAREPFRHVSYAGMACQAHFIGMGFDGYRRAMEWMMENAPGR